MLDLGPKMIGPVARFGLPIGPVSGIGPRSVADLVFTGSSYILGGSGYGAVADVPGWSFTRASEGYALNPAGVLVPFASGAPRITDLGILVEEARTNKCTNYNINPANLTNVTKSGDAASVLSVVDDSAALAVIGLTGNAYCLDNSAGSSAAFANVEGAVGNLNAHTVSAYVRGALLGVALQNVAGYIGGGTYPTYTRISGQKTPDGTGRRLFIGVGAGQVVYFILNQLEEGSFATSPIATAGSAVTRAADNAKLALSSIPSAWTIVVQTRCSVATKAASSQAVEGGITTLSGFSLGTNVAGVRHRLIQRSGASRADTESGNHAGLGLIVGINKLAITSTGLFGANGSSPTSGATPTQTDWAEGISIGSRTGSSLFYNDPISRVTIYDRALNDAQLQGITA